VTNVQLTVLAYVIVTGLVWGYAAYLLVQLRAINRKAKAVAE